MEAVPLEVTIVDLDVFRANPSSVEGLEQCTKVAEALHKHGLLAVRDSRATEAENDGYVACFCKVILVLKPRRHGYMQKMQIPEHA